MRFPILAYESARRETTSAWDHGDSRSLLFGLLFGCWHAFSTRVSEVAFRVTRQKNERKRIIMIRKLKSGEYRLYSRKKDPKTGKRRNLGTFKTREAAEKHEREVQYFKHHA